MQNPYQAYKQTQTTSMTEEEPAIITAKLLEKAAQHLEKAAIAIDENRIEDRVNESNRAIVILTGLQGSLERETEAMAKNADVLDTFFQTMAGLITRMNATNDTNTALSIAKNLHVMAGSWRNLAQQKADYEKQQAQQIEQELGTNLQSNEKGVQAKKPVSFDV